MTAPNRDDGALLAAARAGDPSAFGHLIARHRQGLTLYCYLMLGDPDAAHHAMAETVLTAWLELDVLDPHATVRTWLYRIAVGVCFKATDDGAMSQHLTRTEMNERER
jgi:DNA-directed RNA polymerase specialized sigma24 family protein